MKYSNKELYLFCEKNSITEDMYNRVSRYIWAFMTNNIVEDKGVQLHERVQVEFVHDLTKMICKRAQELEGIFPCSLENEEVKDYVEVLDTMPWELIEEYQALLCFEVIEKVKPQFEASKYIKAMKEHRGKWEENLGGADYTYRDIKMRIDEIVTVNNPIINAYYIGRYDSI